MEPYEVYITPDAEDDLAELDNYISNVLAAPDTAIAYIRDIRERIAGLRDAPKRNRLVEEEPWHSRGLRRLNARGFAVFYSINETHKEVYVQNIIYQKRDLPRVLAELSL